MVASATPSFGALLKRHRRAAGLTQADLGARAGYSTVYISMLERGARVPLPPTVELLAAALALDEAERALLLRLALDAGEHRGGSAPHADTGSPDGAAEGDAEGIGDVPLPVGGFLGALPDTAMVGRDDELARAQVALDMVAAARGRLVLVSGEPGIGKTRFAQEVAAEARGRGFLVATGRSYEPQATVPYYPFFEALSRAYTAAPPETRALVRARWPDVARLLPEWFPGLAPLPATPWDDQQRLLWEVAAFVQALAAQRPVALLLDDLHWADGASVALLLHLARHTREHRVLLLGTYRDVEVRRGDALEAALRDLGREKLVERIPLHRLPPEATARLACGILKQDAIAEEFVAVLHRRTEGNPFFTYEVLRALIERGEICCGADGAWERRALDESDVPESVRSVIGERVARLEPDTQRLLQEASVLGQTFGFDEAVALTGMPELAVERAVEQASAAALLRDTGRDRYTFSHGLVQQALYADLPTRRKRRLHRAAGEALEALRGQPCDCVRRNAAELAWHFLEADEPARALPYELQAGDGAAEVFAYGEAERHYRTAAELARELGDVPAAARALERLGDILFVQFRLADARGALAGALDGHAALGDVESVRRTTAKLVSVERHQQVQAELLLERVRALLEAADERDATPGLALLHAERAMLLLAMDRRDEAVAAAGLATDMARVLDDPRLLGEIEFTRGKTLLSAGVVADAAELYLQLIPALEASGDRDHLSIALNNLADTYLRRGAFETARVHIERAVAVAEAMRSPVRTALTFCTRAEIAYHSGDWREARAGFERVVELARAYPEAATWVGTLCEVMLGLLDVAEGTAARGEVALRRALDAADRHDARQTAQAALAELYLLRGDPPAALAALEMDPDARVTICEDEGDVSLRTVPWRAWAMLLSGQREAAWEQAAAIVAATREHEFKLLLADALRVQGVVAAHLRRWEDAQRALDEAVALSRAIGAPYAEAKALYAYGRLYLALDDVARARECLMAAIAICDRLGERLYAEQIESALAEVRAAVRAS